MGVPGARAAGQPGSGAGGHQPRIDGGGLPLQVRLRLGEKGWVSEEPFLLQEKPSPAQGSGKSLGQSLGPSSFFPWLPFPCGLERPVGG